MIVITRANICNTTSKQRYNDLPDEGIEVDAHAMCRFQTKEFITANKVAAFVPGQDICASSVVEASSMSCAKSQSAF